MFLHNHSKLFKNQEIKHWTNTIILPTDFIELLPIIPMKSFIARKK